MAKKKKKSAVKVASARHEALRAHSLVKLSALHRNLADRIRLLSIERDSIEEVIAEKHDQIKNLRALGTMPANEVDKLLSGGNLNKVLAQVREARNGK